MIIRMLYTVLLSFAAPFLLYGLFRKKSGKPHVGKRWKEHFGISPKLNTTKPLWIHAVSVGETIAATPLIKQIKQSSPDTIILLTTTTPTGAKQAETLGDLVEHRYMPVDFSFAVRAFIKRFSPSQLLIIETELWPNTLVQTHKAGIPVTVINARLSEKSFRGYQRILPLFKQCISPLTKVLCQYESDAKRFEKLGVPKERLTVTGSIKFDIQISEESKDNALCLKEKIGSERPIWIAASTHKGEDEIVLEAHKLLLRSLPDALLILVPRHPERFGQVEQLADTLFSTITRTSTHNVQPSSQVYIGNTMGEMMTFLGSSDVCFMGGSLLGKKVGGHNLLEPAALAKPTLTGPSYYNFADITESLISAGACQIIHNAEELAEALQFLFEHPMKAQAQGKAALKIVNLNVGALKNTLSHVNL